MHITTYSHFDLFLAMLHSTIHTLTLKAAPLAKIVTMRQQLIKNQSWKKPTSVKNMYGIGDYFVLSL